MSPFLFWIFALLTLVFGAAVVVNRNPVASALSLVVSFLGLAALFMSLDAFFVGIIQVLVYAGAVMVLFPVSSSCFSTCRPKNGVESIGSLPRAAPE